MSVFGIALVRDEADIIEATVRHMAGEVDELIVSDNGSTDGTREILADLATELPLEILDDPDPAYYQSAKMSRLAEMARQLGATFVLPFDADEIHVCPGGHIATALAELDEDVLVSEAPLYDHVATGVDSTDPNPIRRLTYRRTAQAPLRKVAVRAIEGVTIHQGNHSASFPGIHHPTTVTDVTQVRHFALRTPEQMVRKARNGGAAYAATDLPEGMGAHWRQWNRLSDDELGDVFRRYYWSADPKADGLIFDPVHAG